MEEVNKKERYTFCYGSNSNHCCFEATVVDTTNPKINPEGEVITCDGKIQYETTCECFDIKDAELICKALNAFDKEWRK